ncbi:MAG: hypothetical protein ACTSQI_15470 [Candidatus Helarchaeota archaeon]
MTKTVCKFYDMLGNHTRFDRGDEKFTDYLRQSLKRKRATFPRFMSSLKQLWRLYTKSEIRMNLARFFIENGPEFMKKWYTDVFSFPKRRIRFEFKQGGSQVDVLITIIYELSEIELQCLKEIIKKYAIEEKTITGAALIALLEPCVLLGEELSRVIEQEIRVSIEDRTVDNSIIKLYLSARPK